MPDEPEAAAPAGEAGLSKNEQKRRAKQEAQAKAKAEKAAAKAAADAAKPKPAAAAAAQEEEEEEQDPTKYFENRLTFVNGVKEKGANPYPHKFQTSMQLPDYVAKYESIGSGEMSADGGVGLAGRIATKRAGGKGRLVFFDVVGDGAKVQVFASADKFSDYAGLEKDEKAARFSALMSTLKRGDIVGVRGTPGKTKRGELSLFPTEMTLLTPCLHMLPKVPPGSSGLADKETRYRQRYLDLIMNPTTRSTFITRTRAINFLRRFLDMHGFLEVETPMMNAIPGGATARPFITKHNDLNLDMYMRIAPELYLKMLVVGGLDRAHATAVHGRLFTAGGVASRHNPEFTTCEFYWAYADYEDPTPPPHTRTHCSPTRTGPHVECRGVSSHSLLCTGPDQVHGRAPLADGAAHTGDDTSATRPRHGLCAEHGVECKPPLTTYRLLDKLVGEFLESQCLHPTFITDHPKIMSPLAKDHRSKPGLTERFELFANYHEMCNAYTELNDPVEQRARFAAQATWRRKAAGDDEAMFVDDGFITAPGPALEYGLPPTAGWGMGIDRLCMLLTDNESIKEVLLFPAMRPVGMAADFNPDCQ
ncbi:putative Lysyl-tRNA synthetase [Emiliania huxleyi CCMP1516]|uniref:lysine--tRNA ligase n=4 Tax=Emiliania huxleyi TaxID=2903 RepID=A0A0D3KEK8_EMIH1|nr:putative Lysyl-tRNA synthetase [Emiliania huxleyi CCMP1516]EOD34193.1 putative Lysyl-tRNA synthetase [Emiliania huxleyi CCMP1516]|eukprot:XP_005786622.1 putative Lysyl-tRNA synthetase [Emiliania huxleyi CCMP1516]